MNDMWKKKGRKENKKERIGRVARSQKGDLVSRLDFFWIFFQAGDLRSWPGSGYTKFKINVFSIKKTQLPCSLQFNFPSRGFSFDGITWITCNVSILPCHRVMNSMSDWRQTLSDNVMKTCLPIQVQLRFPPFPPAWSLEHFATADPRSWRQPCCNLSDWQIGMFVICQGACCELLDHV